MARGKLEGGAFTVGSTTQPSRLKRKQAVLNQFAKKPKPPGGWWNNKIKQGLSPSAAGRIWYHTYNDERRQLATQKYAGEDVTEKERAFRIRQLKQRIEKTRVKYDGLSKNPQTFSYDVAFGNPGGNVSKSLHNRIERWHNKLRDLSFEEGKLKTHVLILKGSPLTDQNRRDYIYFARWGTGTTKKAELDPIFNRAIQDAPQYVQRAYQDNYQKIEKTRIIKKVERKTQPKRYVPSSKTKNLLIRYKKYSDQFEDEVERLRSWSEVLPVGQRPPSYERAATQLSTFKKRKLFPLWKQTLQNVRENFFPYRQVQTFRDIILAIE